MASLKEKVLKIINVKKLIKEALERKNQTVPENALLEEYPDIIDDIVIVDNQEKSVSITANGTTTVTPDSGKTGLSKVTVTTNVARDAVQYGPTGTITKLFDGTASSSQLTKSGSFTIPANKNCVVFVSGVTVGNIVVSCKVNNVAQTTTNLAYPVGSAHGGATALGVYRWYIAKSASARTCSVEFSSPNGTACCAYYVM